MIVKNIDPQTLELKNLVDELNYHTKLYDEGNPIISDKEWDDKWFHLREKEKEYGLRISNSPTQTLEYRVVNQLQKVRHNHKMLSLDKTKNWDDFCHYFGDRDVIGMLKLDGLTCSVRYVNGVLSGAETRGNGEIGENVLHNAYAIDSIPNKIKHEGELVLDGEIICTDKDFKKFKDEYKNPRNFASGSIRLLDAKECKNRKLTFVVWNVIKGIDDNSFLSRLQKIEDLGFNVVPWTSSFDWDAKEYLIDQGKELGYPIDGLVGRFDDIQYGISLGETNHHSRAAYAFKFYDEEYETELTNISYDIGRTGVLTPVAEFTPIDIDGSTISRASLHNLSVMRETLHGNGWQGQKVKVFKSNEIIPQISSAEEDNEFTKTYFDIPNICPICGQPTEEVTADSGTTTLICSNLDCDGKLINKLDHFCGKKGLDIKGLSKRTLEKLIEWNWVNNIIDLFNLKEYRTEWVKKVGFGPVSVDKILNAIESAKTCDLDKFICAIGIPLIGSTASKELAKEFKTWENFINAVDNDKYHFYNIDTFGPEMELAIKNFNYSIADELATFMTIKPYEENTNTNFMNDLTFCITGSLKTYKNRDELKSIIENNGGRVTGSVSKKTNYLINNDNVSSSSKNITAQKFNIPIITEEEFKNLFDLN